MYALSLLSQDDSYSILDLSVFRNYVVNVSYAVVSHLYGGPIVYSEPRTVMINAERSMWINLKCCHIRVKMSPYWVYLELSAFRLLFLAVHNIENCVLIIFMFLCSECGLSSTPTCRCERALE